VPVTKRDVSDWVSGEQRRLWEKLPHINNGPTNKRKHEAKAKKWSAYLTTLHRRSKWVTGE